MSVTMIQNPTKPSVTKKMNVHESYRGTCVPACKKTIRRSIPIRGACTSPSSFERLLFGRGAANGISQPGGATRI